EGYDAGGNVYLSREVPKWVNELVGSADLALLKNDDELRDELICLLFHAVVGLSRLPLTSLEAPLPGFSLGELAYFHRPNARPPEGPEGPMRSVRDLILLGFHDGLARLENVKLLETVLRAVSVEHLAATAQLFDARWLQLGHSSRELPSLFRALFNE